MATRSECTDCGKVFASVAAFDAHRTGNFARRTRRCLSTHDMQVAGMTRNAQGQWIPPMTQAPAPWYEAKHGPAQK